MNSIRCGLCVAHYERRGTSFVTCGIISEPQIQNVLLVYGSLQCTYTLTVQLSFLPLSKFLRK